MKKSKIPVMYMLVCIYIIFTAFDLLENSEITLQQKISYAMLILAPLALIILSVWQRNSRLENKAYAGTAVYLPFGIASALTGLGLMFGLVYGIIGLIVGAVVAVLGINRIRNGKRPETRILVDLPPEEALAIQKRHPYENFRKAQLIPVASGNLPATLAGSGQEHLLLTKDFLILQQLKEKKLLAEQMGESPKELPAFAKETDRLWCGIALNPVVVAVHPANWKKTMNTDPVPLKSLETLLSPNLTGSFILPNPETSKAGFILLSSLAQSLGLDEGLDLYANLRKQAAKLADDNVDIAEAFAKPSLLAVVGMLQDVLKANSRKLNLVVSVPSGSGGETLCASIPKNSPDLEQSASFLDFLAGRAGNEVFNYKALLMPTHPKALVPPGSPVLEESGFYQEYDYVKALNDRDTLIGKWREKN